MVLLAHANSVESAAMPQVANQPPVGLPGADPRQPSPANPLLTPQTSRPGAPAQNPFVYFDGTAGSCSKTAAIKKWI